MNQPTKVWKTTKVIYYSKSLVRPNHMGLIQVACKKTITDWVVSANGKTTCGFSSKKQAQEFGDEIGNQSWG